MALSAGGLPRLAYRRSNGELMFVACDEPGCDTAEPSAIRHVHAAAPGTAAALGADGSLLVAYVHTGRDGEQVRVAQAARR